jgi:2,3-bisphosphoglycerate-dependent phosphoglycerate mutase
MQAQKMAEQLKNYQIDYAFTSHLKRARKTLEIALQGQTSVPIFVDDRLIERCYGVLQGKNKRKMACENPEWYAQIHRGYNVVPPDGESLKMVESRVTSFLDQLKDWLEQNMGNVAISCHNNSIRPIRKIFEHLSIEQTLELESPQDSALIYDFHLCNLSNKCLREKIGKPNWEGVVIPRKVKLATDSLNLLKAHYR